MQGVIGGHGIYCGKEAPLKSSHPLILLVDEEAEAQCSTSAVEGLAQSHTGLGVLLDLPPCTGED